MMIRLLKKEDPDFAKIAIECAQEVHDMFIEAIEQEESWTDFLFKDGSIIGLNAEILKQYIRWIGSKRMGAVGVKCSYTVQKSNPIPWSETWISGGNVQVAPQETEISSYVIGNIDKDVDNNSLKGLQL